MEQLLKYISDRKVTKDTLYQSLVEYRELEVTTFFTGIAFVYSFRNVDTEDRS